MRVLKVAGLAPGVVSVVQDLRKTLGFPRRDLGSKALAFFFRSSWSQKVQGSNCLGSQVLQRLS